MSIIKRLFKCAYSLLYHQFAWTYDYVAAIVSLGRWNSWVQHTLPLMTGQRILEIGFGPGHLLNSSIRAGKNIVGIDESKQMVRRASKQIKSLGIAPPLVRGNIYTLPFRDCVFDQVISTFPSEYIFKKVAISEIHRILIPGGQLIILPFAWIKGKLWYEMIANRLLDVNDITQPWEDRYCEAIRQKGFETTITRINDTRSDVIFIIATKSN